LASTAYHLQIVMHVKSFSNYSHLEVLNTTTDKVFILWAYQYIEKSILGWLIQYSFIYRYQTYILLLMIYQNIPTLHIYSVSQK